MSPVTAWRELVAALRGRRGRSRQRIRRSSRARLADELLATLSPQVLFMAGYPAHRPARAYRRSFTYVRVRAHAPTARH